MPSGVKDEFGSVGSAKGYMKTRYGRFNPLKPDVKDVDVRDIAYGLSGEYRYSAQSRLTVAQHSVVGSYYCDEPLAFLFHDTAEGLGFRDISTPLKHSPSLAPFRRLESAALKVVWKALKLPASPTCAAVKSTDRAMYVTESKIIWKREVLKGETLLPFTLDQSRLWPPDEAERRFLQRYGELTGKSIGEVTDGAMFSIPGKFLQPRMMTCKLTGVSVAESSAKAAAAIASAPLRPPNSFTHAEYVKENGVSRATATLHIAKLRESGRVRARRFQVVRSDGQKQTVNGWQLTDAIDKPSNPV